MRYTFRNVSPRLCNFEVCMEDGNKTTGINQLYLQSLYTPRPSGIEDNPPHHLCQHKTFYPANVFSNTDQGNHYGGLTSDTDYPLAEGVGVIVNRHGGRGGCGGRGTCMEVAEVAEDKKEVTLIVLHYCVILQLHYEYLITIEYGCCDSVVVMTTYFKMSNCVAMLAAPPLSWICPPPHLRRGAPKPAPPQRASTSLQTHLRACQRRDPPPPILRHPLILEPTDRQRDHPLPVRSQAGRPPQ